MDDTWWLASAARIAADLDEGTRDEAAEVFATEAARCRLADRRGDAVVHLLGGHVLEGQLRPGEPVAECLWLDGRMTALVPVEAITFLEGGHRALRLESAGRERTLASVLREQWALAGPVRVLTRDAAARGGVLEFVGADHVDLRTPSGTVTVPFAAVAAWLLP